MIDDLRHAFRGLARTPGFTSIAVLTLAIGIGASTAVFSVANWVLLRPVPGTVEPDRLVRVQTWIADRQYSVPLSHPNYADLRTQATALTDLAAVVEPSMSLSADGAVEPRRVDGALVTANYFDVLGVEPALGRTFTNEEAATAAGSGPVAVVSHRLWHGTFGGDPATVGRTVAINGHPFTVIGVAPEGFLGDDLPGTTDLWVPVSMHGRIVPGRSESLLADRRDWFYPEMVGRLAAGVEPAAAEAELRGIVEALADTYPGENGNFTSLGLEPVLTHGLGLPPGARADVRQTVWILAGVVGMLLLLTCANVANLLLARASRRRRELAVRQALGAGRRRLARLFLAESTLLALAGAAVALVLSVWLDHLLGGVRLVSDIAALGEMQPDARVFGFAVLTAIGAAALFGAGPALAASRQDPAQHLKKGTRTSARRPLLRHGLVATQIALSLALVIGAGLLVRTVRALQAEQLGYTTERVLTFSVDLDSHGYTDVATREFQYTLLERVRTLPGVGSAGTAEARLLGGFRLQNTVAPFGQDTDESGVRVDYNRVSPGFFEALEMPIVEGRGFRETDYRGSDEAARVTVVSETLARQLFPHGDPVVGRLIADDEQDAPDEIVGVVGDARTRNPGEAPVPVQYLPMNMGATPGSSTFYVRATTEPANLVASIRRAVREMDPTVPLHDVRALRDQVNAAIAEQRVVAGLSGVFSLLAMLIAVVGLYGVMAYLVTERTREFGIRTALGADGRRVLRLVMRQALAVAAVGLMFGAVGATQLTRLIESRLYGVTRLDPLTFALAAAVLTAAVLLASYIPARRATRVDPMVALREE